MNKPEIVVSGARASGKLHIGNYLGALKQWLQLQSDGHTCYFFIADLHGITTPFEPKELHQNTLDVAATYLAAGIDPNKSVFFLQNHVLEHATLAWIFNCITPLGELERMTQFKDKSQNQESINAGLLTYPTLMAADILMYKAAAVPVGEDQVQHVELARVVARKFNSRFGQTFPEPKHLMRDEGLVRIKSLSEPTKKMSKTGDEALLMDDEPEEIMRKLKKAVTGSDASGQNPGAENLLFLLSHFGTKQQTDHFLNLQKAGQLKYSDLKEALAQDISDYFAEFREKKKELLAKPKFLAEVLGDGAAKARKVAQATLLEVKQKTGLL
ncbi:MAG: tryptophan--tRNA ligase [Patescibacteria group bacterium]|nr:tryptophan--tRNA ligase [Patescibacteria group bacterium]